MVGKDEQACLRQNVIRRALEHQVENNTTNMLILMFLSKIMRQARAQY